MWQPTTQMHEGSFHWQLKQEARMWFFQDNQDDKTMLNDSDKMSQIRHLQRKQLCE